MKFLVLNVYPFNELELVKDTSEGYNTVHYFKNRLFLQIVKKNLSRIISTLRTCTICIYTILKKKSFAAQYVIALDNKKSLEETGYIIMLSSIIRYKYENKVLKDLNKKIKNNNK